MERKLATVREILDVQPIPDADAIEKIKIDGWWCVSKKDEFKKGDKCIYFEIDSLLPMVEQFEFLAKQGTKKTIHNGEEVEGYRLRTVKLRGQVSQGLALPVSAFVEVHESMYDVTELLRVVKYEEPVPAEMSGEVKGGFPSFIPTTDEHRVQNCLEELEKYRGRSFTRTEKLDGTSTTYFKHEGEFGVCGRNWELKRPTPPTELDKLKGKIYEVTGWKIVPKSWKLKKFKRNTQWDIAEELKLTELLPDGFAVQGELIGEGIQSNRLKIKGKEFRVFYVYDINRRTYLTPTEMQEFCENIGLKTVPIIDTNFIMDYDEQQLLEMSDRKSALNDKCNIEGIVYVLNDAAKKFSFKVISNKYLIKHNL